MDNNNLRKQYRLQNWIEAIRDQKASGLSIRQWCEKHHVTKYQFYYRQRAVRKAMADAVNELSSTQLTVSDTVQAVPPNKKTTVPAQPGFIKIPQNILPGSADTVLHIRRGSIVLEVSNDASDRILGLLREVVLHAE